MHDLNPDVLGDLISASMACRAWKPAADNLIHSRVRLYDARMLDRLCGYRLNSLVFRSSSNSITTLSLDLRSIEKPYTPLIAQMDAPSVSSPDIVFMGDEQSLLCYEILEAFFSQCQRIRNLRLESCNLKEDSATFSPIIKEGFSRLEQLDLIECFGDLRMFIESL
jgi:hypothetical protein